MKTTVRSARAPVRLLGLALGLVALTGGETLLIAAQPKPGDGAKRQPRGAKGSKRPRRPDNAPKLGALAPGFTLKTLDKKDEVKLESFRGRKPVVLVFGSYT